MNDRLRVRVAAVAVVLAAPAALLSSAPALAQSSDFYAYVGGAAVTPTACPQTPTVAQQCTLAQALALVPAGGTVLLATPGAAGSYFGDYTVATTGTSAAAPVTIAPADGVSSPTLDGDFSAGATCTTSTCAGPVLTVAAGVTADIQAVILSDANNTRSNAGGCVNDLGSLTLTGVTVTGCQAVNGGGAAVGPGASLTVTGSTFSNDTARSYGGAIQAANGAAGTLTISGTTFSGDTAPYDGGAIVNGVRAGTGTATISDSVFSGDSSKHGGAIDNGDTGTGTLTVSGSTFSNNSGTTHGGAIDSGDGTGGIGNLTVAGSTFTGNSAPHGGAIDSAQSYGTDTLSIATSTLTGNSATTQGSAINSGDFHGVGTALVVRSTVDANNGSAAIDAATGRVQIAGSIVAGSAAVNCAGNVTDLGYNLEDDSAARCGFTSRQYDLIGVDPQLAALANNGGTTETMSPSGTSPVLNAIPNPATIGVPPGYQSQVICPITDQPGDPAANDTYGCSIGSVDPQNQVPVVTSVSPASGPAAGGTAVTITGGHFAPGATVTFGGAPASDVTVVSPTQITATSPAFPGLDGAGTVAVAVTNPQGPPSPSEPADQYIYFAADWSGYLAGSAHSSFNAGATSISPGTVANLAPIWQWPPPKSPNSGSQADFASPVVYNGVVYVGLANGEMFALSETTHKIVWSQFLGFQTSTSCAGTAGITGTATVAADPVTGAPTVYVNAPDGYLYALDAATGNINWRSVVGIPSTTVNDYYAWGSPTVANGKVYVGIASRCDNPLVQGGVLAFDQGTGSQLASWFTLPVGTLGGSVWTSVAVLPDGSVAVSTGNSGPSPQKPFAESLVILDGTTLKPLDSWEIPKSQQIFDSDFGGSPTVFTASPGGVTTTMVGACNKNGFYYAFRANDVHAGPLWQYQMGVPAGSGTAGGGQCDAAAIWDGHQLVIGGGSPTTISGVSYQGSVQAVDPTTGQPIWQTGLPGYVIGTPSMDGAGVIAAPVYFATNGASGVYLLSAATGAILRYLSTVPTGAFAQPVFDGGDLLVGDLDSLPLEEYAVTTPGQSTPISLSPATVTHGTTATFTISGASNLTAPATVIVGGTAVRVTSVKVTSPTTATVTAVVGANAPVGAQFDVTLVEPNLTSYSCTGCLTIG
jgi:predicted outer membrane repeat protein